MATVEQIRARLAREEAETGYSMTQAIRVVVPTIVENGVNVLPNRKVGASALTGALATLLVFLTESFGLVLPDSAIVAITTLVVAGIAYLVPLPKGSAEE